MLYRKSEICICVISALHLNKAALMFCIRLPLSPIYMSHVVSMAKIRSALEHIRLQAKATLVLLYCSFLRRLTEFLCWRIVHRQLRVRCRSMAEACIGEREHKNAKEMHSFVLT